MITLKEATEQGLTRYFTGKPCKHGHVCERIVSKRTCVECSRSMSKRWADTNPDKQSARVKSYYEANKEITNKRSTERRLADPETHNRHKRNYYKRNKAKELARNRFRKGAMKSRGWAHEQEAISAFYGACPEGHQVDHIIPLVHEKVCGLHCLANLQYLTGPANAAKSNRWEP